MKNRTLLLLFTSASFLLYFATLAYIHSRLPERVATNFGAGGVPNDWMTREEFLHLGLISGIALIIFSAVSYLMFRFLPLKAFRFHVFGALGAEYWRRPENTPRARQKLIDGLLLCASTTMMIFSFVTLLLLSANLKPEPRLNTTALIITTAVYLIAGVIFAIAEFRSFRIPPKTESDEMLPI